MQKNYDYADFRDYVNWTPIKAKVHNTGRIRTFSEGQFWWVVVGENVGIEIGGKGQLFLRPVYILRKNSALGFIGIPVTSQPHKRKDYVKIRFKDKDEYLALTQVKTFSSFRLKKKMGEADDSDRQKISDAFLKLFNNKK